MSKAFIVGGSSVRGCNLDVVDHALDALGAGSDPFGLDTHALAAYRTRKRDHALLCCGVDW